MRREPPAGVRRLLAQEVGFACPVNGCGSPYLTWHHFDPPWAIEEHHNPTGMVALCRDHHPEADAAAFTLDQLRGFKTQGRDRSQALGARFNWMRRELLAVVGGNFYYETPVAIRYFDTPVVWFNRDDADLLLVNVNMLTTSQEPRMAMRDNFWLTEGSDDRKSCAHRRGASLAQHTQTAISCAWSSVILPPSVHSTPDTPARACPLTSLRR
jgi:hypothetical protein